MRSERYEFYYGFTTFGHDLVVADSCVKLSIELRNKVNDRLTVFEPTKTENGVTSSK